MPKPLILIGGSAIAIALGNTRLGPIVALLLLAVLSYIALTSKTFGTAATTGQIFQGQQALLA